MIKHFSEITEDKWRIPYRDANVSRSSKVLIYYDTLAILMHNTNIIKGLFFGVR